MTTIKNQCSPDVTFNHIKAVQAYIELTNHLRELGYDYSEFEMDFNNEKKVKSEPIVETSTTQGGDSSFVEVAKTVKIEDSFETDVDDFALSALVDEIEKGGYIRKKDPDDDIENSAENVEVPEPPKKKQKLKMSLLDSPPRLVT